MKIIHDKKIDYIFHAAYKHVKYLEDNVYAAIKNNIFGTLSLLKASKHKKFILLLFQQTKLSNLKPY